LARVSQLEPGTSPFVQAFESALDAPIEGWLRLSGRSLLFEPANEALPIISVKLSAATMQRVGAGDELALTISSPGMWLQLANGQHHVHVADAKAASAIEHRFAGAGSSGLPRAFVSRVMVMVDSNAAGPDERQDALRAIQEGCEGQVPFSLSWLGSALETIVHQTQCHRIAPLTQERGRLVLTTKALYFQPTFALSSVPYVRVAIADIQRLATRRVDFVDRAVEFAVRPPALSRRGDTTSSQSFAKEGLFFFRFPTAVDRNALLSALRKTCDSVKPKPLSLLANFGDELQARLSAMREAWQDGRVSNFDYLMFLNWCAGRSLADVAQYPVLPWVVADYHSTKLDLGSKAALRDLAKPIGAINASRLAGFEARAEELKSMGEDPYLYGSHYSNPAYVTFWLLRSRPEFMLVLHSGKFDHASRIFDSIPGAWESVTTGPTDLKELPPQFFFGDGSFLATHGSTLAFRDIGLRADGARPNEDVHLPPWASTPLDFVTRNREALESEHVSSRLHLWIDLMFGCAQTGEEAWTRKNVFHPLSYESSRVLLDKQETPEARAAMAAHIREFGQTPAQLFLDPHPPRRCGATPPRVISTDSFVSEEETKINATVLSAATSGASPLAASVSTTVRSLTPSNSMDASAAELDRAGTASQRSTAPSTPTAPALETRTPPAALLPEPSRSLKVEDPFAQWLDAPVSELKPQWHRRIEPMVVAQTALRCVEFVAGDPSASPRLIVADAAGKLSLVTVDSMERKPLSIAVPSGLGPVIAVVSSRTAPGLATAIGKNGVVAAVEFDKAAAVDAVRANQVASEVTGSVLRFAHPWHPHDASGGAAILTGARDGILKLVPTSKSTAAVAPPPKRKLAFLPGRSDGPTLQWDLESALVAGCVSPDGNCAVGLNEECGLFAVGFVDAEPQEGKPTPVALGQGAVVPPFVQGSGQECCELPEDAAKGAEDVLGMWFVSPASLAVLSLGGRLTLVSAAYETFGELQGASNIAASVPEAAHVTCAVPMFLPGQGPEDGGVPRAFAIGTRGGTVAIVDPRTGRLRQGGRIQLPSGADVTSITVCGRRIAAGDANGNVHVYVATFA
jgi:factor associated with neutral sphingomyelinase activation